MRISASAKGVAAALALAASLALADAQALAQSDAIKRAVETQTDTANEAARRWFEGLPEAERRAIQDALVWTGDYNGTNDGSFGKRTRDAIATFAARAKKPANGTLDDTTKAALLAAAEKARAGMRFAVLTDQRTGIRMGVPQALMTKSRAAGTGTSWEAADGSASLSTDIAGDGDLAALLARLSAGFPAGRTAYKLLRPDFLVVAGESSGRTIYARYARGMVDGRPALRGFTLSYQPSTKATFDRLAVAIANSFEPFPTPAETAAPATAAQPQQPNPAGAVSTGIIIGPSLVLTSYSACARPTVQGKPAAVRKRDEASGLTLLQLTEGSGPPAPVAAASSETGEVLVLAFAPRPQPATGDRPAFELQVSSGQLREVGGKPYVAAALQQPGAAAAIVSRRGELIGFATLPSNAKPRLIAGVVPESTYPLASAETFLGAGAAHVNPGKTVGEILGSIRGALLPVTCAATP